MGQTHAQTKKYLEARVMTAPREELLLMLLDGAFKFADAAKRHLEEKKYDEYCNALIRAQRIMVELSSSLRKDMLGEDLYNNLVGLYLFVYRKFVEANLQRDAVRIDEGLRILAHLREMWREAVEKHRADERAGVAPKAEGTTGLNLSG